MGSKYKALIINYFCVFICHENVFNIHEILEESNLVMPSSSVQQSFRPLHGIGGGSGIPGGGVGGGVGGGGIPGGRVAITCLDD